MHASDYLVHFSNMLLLVSYSVRDMLWLRWFAVAAALTNIPYFLVQADILWPPVLWAAVFTAINLYQIARIYMERRPVVLSADEQRLYDLSFRALYPREFLSLTLAGGWRDAVVGERLLKKGQPASEICIPIAGALEVRRDGALAGSVEPGQIVGTGLILSGHPSPVDAAFSTPGRYFAWPFNSLRAYLDRKPELRTTMLRLANTDLADKLEWLMARH